MQVVILWLINEHGEILMAKRAAQMSTDAGVWGPSVSGKVDSGETSEEAVLREANEELGLTVEEISPIFLHKETYADHSDGNIREFRLFYATVPSAIVNKLTLEAKEVSAVKWFTKDDLQKLASARSKNLIISSAKEVWESIFFHLNPVLGTR